MSTADDGSSVEIESWRNFPCKEWPNSTNSRGYGKVYFEGELIGAHRREYILHHGIISPSLDVMHLCNNRICYEIQHLKLGTRSENMMYAGRHNMLSRDTTGEKNSQSKLTEADVIEIRRLCAETNKTRTAIASMYGVSSQLIGQIVRRVRWTHVQTNG